MVFHDYYSQNLPIIFNSFTNKNYLYLLTGFFVCGFHVAFITSHLPAYLAGLNIAGETAAIAIALIGFFNVFGAFFAGILGSKYSKAKLLSTLYLSRALCIFLFFIFPKSETSVYIFASLMGILWLSTVPLTSGLVSDIFGSKNIGSLFGFVFLSHQLGAFFLLLSIVYSIVTCVLNKQIFHPLSVDGINWVRLSNCPFACNVVQFYMCFLSPFKQ